MFPRISCPKNPVRRRMEPERPVQSNSPVFSFAYFSVGIIAERARIPGFIMELGARPNVVSRRECVYVTALSAASGSSSSKNINTLLARICEARFAPVCGETQPGLALERLEWTADNQGTYGRTAERRASIINFSAPEPRSLHELYVVYNYVLAINEKSWRSMCARPPG